MAPEGLEKGLKAATDKAPEHGVLDLNLADSRRRPDLLDRRRADKTDLHTLDRYLVCHEPEPSGHTEHRNPWNYRISA